MSAMSQHPENLLETGRLHNLWGAVQNENAPLLCFKNKLLKSNSRQKWQSIKSSMESLSAWDLCGYREPYAQEARNVMVIAYRHVIDTIPAFMEL